MLFNSFEFLLFFPIVIIIYFLIPYKFRWLHLLVASCIFYMAFVPVYILILLFTIVVDYIAGIMIEKAPVSRRKLFLVMSIIANVGVLAFFKYYNFFTENFNALFHFANINAHIPLLTILLPIGLSFHTFQAMSYTIEVYRGNQAAERHFGIYALYVMFFPQLVAGPIERPQNILHQFREKHDFDFYNLKEGLKQMLWGFFKKIVIADRLAIVVNNVYDHPEKFNGPSFTLAIIFFAFQIYCDFSAYSDIAMGSARVIGYKLMLNFNRPFHSKSITEFWRRWHISLSTWFYDYVFNPTITALRHWEKKAIAFGLLLTFFLSGLWHGAGWKFIIYGLIHGIAIVYEFYTKKSRKRLFKKLPAWLGNMISKCLTFACVAFSWIFFRTASMHEAVYVIRHLGAGWGNVFSGPGIKSLCAALGANDTISGIYNVVSGILLILMMELAQNKTKDNPVITIVKNKPLLLRWSVYYFLIISILLIGAFNNQEFIYFQF
jgi:alginate O-acetyltransferase complex protein AlgI